MKISIVTVSYNAEETLARTLESVASQTYPNVEHILVDGGSTDTSMLIAEKVGKHLTVSLSEPDRGIYDAMNKGLALATGDVITFLNADDYYDSDDIVMEVAERIIAQQLDFLTGNVAYFKSGSRGRVIRVYDSGRFRIQKLAFGLMPAHPALFIRRDIVVKVGGFNAEYLIAGDFELVARILTQQKIRLGHFPKVLVKMQLGGISTSGWSARMLMNREILRACADNGIKTNLLKIWLRYPQKLFEFIRFDWTPR